MCYFHCKSFKFRGVKNFAKFCGSEKKNRYADSQISGVEKKCGYADSRYAVTRYAVTPITNNPGLSAVRIL